MTGLTVTSLVKRPKVCLTAAFFICPFRGKAPRLLQILISSRQSSGTAPTASGFWEFWARPVRKPAGALTPTCPFID